MYRPKSLKIEDLKLSAMFTHLVLGKEKVNILRKRMNFCQFVVNVVNVKEPFKVH